MSKTSGVAVPVRQPLTEAGQTSGRGDGLTILIGGHNHRSVLPRLLRGSLDALGHLEEAGFAAEILVIDNASRDGSQKLLRTVQALYDEPRLRVLSLVEERDWAALRNLGLARSRFRYACVVEPNREVVPANLPLFLKSIVDTRAGMVYGNLLDKEDGEVVDVRANMAVALRLPEANYLFPMPILDAPKILQLGGYSRIHPRSPESWEIVLRLISDEELIAFVPTVMGYHHRGIDPEAWEPVLSEGGSDALQRIHDWKRTYKWDHARIGRLYHPHVGFLDE